MSVNGAMGIRAPIVHGRSGSECPRGSQYSREASEAYGDKSVREAHEPPASTIHAVESAEN